jgi:hypothetical protein
LTTPALQILAVAGPVSGREGEGVLVPTGEFFLWPALLSLAATRVDVAQQRDHLHTAVIEAAKEYAIRTPAGDTMLTAFRAACTAPGGHPAGDFAVNRTLLLCIPEVALLFVDLLRQG